MQALGRNEGFRRAECDLDGLVFYCETDSLRGDMGGMSAWDKASIDEARKQLR